MLKLLALDMDGTLLNKNHTISWENLKALRYARSKGVTLAIASGRAFFDVRHLLSESDIDMHIIGANGATIHTMDGTLLGADYLDRSDALERIAELTAHQFYLGVYTPHHIYVPSDGKKWLYRELHRLHMHEDRSVGFQGASRDAFYRVFDDWREFATRGSDFYKIIVFSFDDEKLNKMRAAYEALHRYSIVSSGTGNFEIMAPNVSKGNALYQLAGYLDIPLSDVMAVGDNYNDLSMFEVAGTAVAMGNAGEDIKRRADWVTLSCAQNGVAQAIYQGLQK
ncbi:MAG: Cof-type HAD-IIB family hydrolase [Sporolactobacillus sp.]|mgnify:CR=1 FL=1|jgi:Cof subfamily protein (haloacid dehalogenase superfamily)|nr:Cof-type HAD-IIB family hydrolase [Sporolactobacillus sp.]MCI1882727.1 Cof-type HAD-IIB family hydrolase [Sporolactobacillus sp.]